MKQNKEIDEKHKHIIKKLDKMKKNMELENKKISKKTFQKTTIIGLILITIGLILIINPITQNPDSTIEFLKNYLNSLNIKLGFGVILIALFLIFLITKKNIEENNKNSIQQKINIALTTWIILTFFITIHVSIEIYFILIFIGTLVTKELTDEFTSKKIKLRLNIFIIVFLIVFIIIISQKIINIL